MFKNKINRNKPIIVPKPKTDEHNFRQDIKPQNKNKDYENIRKNS